MKHLTLILLICLSPSIFSCTKDDTYQHDDSLPLIDNIKGISDSYISKGIPGIVLLLDDPINGMNIVESGYAKTETQIPLTKDHLFHSASLMKTYTASCIFLLLEQGLLDIDDNISLHLTSELIKKIPNGSVATIESLLNHSSGIPDFAEQDEYLQDLISYTEGQKEPDNFLEYIKQLPPDFEVGTSHSYSNSGFYILSLIVANLSQENFEDFLYENIIKKLALENTYYGNYPSPPDYSRVPEYYIDWESNGMLTNSSNLENKATQTFEGFSGLLATIEDYHKFIKALFVDKSLLTEESLDKMMTVTHSDNFGYGQGLEVILSDNYPDKYGHKGGTQSSFFYYPDKDLIILSMINYSFNDGSSPYDLLAIVPDIIGRSGNLIGDIELCLF